MQFLLLPSINLKYCIIKNDRSMVTGENARLVLPKGMLTFDRRQGPYYQEVPFRVYTILPLDFQTLKDKQRSKAYLFH